MNRLNPLYIGAVLIVILLFLSSQLLQKKEELQDIKNSYITTQKVAIELSSLKKVYSDKKRLKKSLQHILNLSSLRSTDIVQTDKNSATILNIKSMQQKALNLLMGKILNANFNIKILKIKKLSDKKASLYMEIKW
jgi:hypothetical protein